MNLIKNDTENAIQDIQTSWNRSVEALLETAQMLIQYQQRADWFEIQDELASRNIMKSSVISMMMSIGRNQLLNNTQYLDQLPRSYNSLYHLSTIDEPELKEALDTKKVTQDSKLSFIRDLAKPKTNAKIAPTFVTKKLIISEADYKPNQIIIDTLLTDIASKYQFIKIK